MTINLPDDVTTSIRAEVQRGRFATIDDAIAEAWRDFVRHQPQIPESTELGSIGAMHDAAEELDEAVGHAMTLRGRTWRISAEN